MSWENNVRQEVLRSVGLDTLIKEIQRRCITEVYKADMDDTFTLSCINPTSQKGHSIKVDGPALAILIRGSSAYYSCIGEGESEVAKAKG